MTASPSRPLRVVFCWAEMSGYAAACFRALSRRPELDVHVLHTDRLSNRPNPFDAGPLLDGVSHEMFDARRQDLDAYLRGAVAERRPDVMVLCGWIFWPYTRLVNAPEFAGVAKLLGMDTPWRGTLVQRFARLRLGHFIRSLDLVVTASDRSAEYARRIGVSEARLRPGYYGFDDTSFTAAASRRPSPWPRRFLFVGRYVEEKDLATLIAGYRLYRGMVSDPWPLTCCGQGPEGYRLRDVEGVTDAGFSPPSAMPAVFGAHGAFVLPSRFEPWGVVIAEAAASGLPVICSSSCGAALDIVRPYYNGAVVPPADPAALAHALRWIHDHEAQLPEIGRRGQSLAAAFAAEAWAERWLNYMHEAIDRPKAS